MNREEAATLLGVGVDADTEEIRRAWRLWAKVAHPDVGGDPMHFARLDQARQVMAQAPRRMRIPKREVDPELSPRMRLSEVFRRPRQIGLVLFGLVVLGAGLALASAALPHVLRETWATPLVVAAVPCAGAAAGWAVGTAGAVLAPAADRGHRITAIMLLWMPIVGGQLVISSVLGSSLLPVLPVLALPIVAVIAASGFTQRTR